MNKAKVPNRPAFSAVKHSLRNGCAFAITVFAIAFAGPVCARADSVSPHLAEGETAAPYVAISGLQSWIVEGANGERRLVFTTSDGMTIEGPLYDKNGRDLSTALLGGSQAIAQSTPAPEATLPGIPPLPDVSTDVALALPDASNGSTPKAPASPAQSSTVDSASGSDPAVATAATPDTVPVLPQAKDASELLKQAGWFTAWFSAGKPKPDAPVLYFMADPTCIHCAASTERLAPLVESGDLDLRIILAPIRSKEAVYEAASIIQDPSPATTFVAHEKSLIGSTPSPLVVRTPENIEPDVVRALQRNVEWGRANNVKGVPFWLYNGKTGPSLAAGRITDEIIKDVQPLPSEYAMEANQ